MSRVKKAIVICVSIFIFLLVIAGAAYFIFRSNKPIPSSIQHQISFVIFYPSKTLVTVSKSTIKYDKSSQLLTFTGTLVSNDASIIFSEEVSPETFSDVPQTFDKLIQTMHEYQTF